MAVDINQILSTINTALTVIKTVANTPGINMIPYVSTISGAIDALQMAVTLGANVTPYIKAIAGTFGAGATVPTLADLDALDAKIDALRSQLQAPLPDKDPDEPD